MYDPALGRFHTQDRFSEKYYSLSNYQYVGNNPILNIDVNGDSIWVYSGNNQALFYTQGMQYNGNDQFVSNAVKFLNEMGTVKAGKQILNDLGTSANHFDFTNTAPVDKQGNAILDNTGTPVKGVQFDNITDSKYANGGGNIRANALMGNWQNSQKLEMVSHELFHGAQFENGLNAGTINGEVGAYLFGKSVVEKVYGVIQPYGIEGTKAGNTYEKAMFNLHVGGFNQQDYNTALTNFKMGSVANQTGMYNKHNIGINYKPLIKHFIPF
jgi:hypothetical protein